MLEDKNIWTTVFFLLTREYADNVRIADQIVKDVENLIQSFYGDNDTVFIFTSDHGMTDWGEYDAYYVHTLFLRIYLQLSFFSVS